MNYEYITIETKFQEEGIQEKTEIHDFLVSSITSKSKLLISDVLIENFNINNTINTGIYLNNVTIKK